MNEFFQQALEQFAQQSPLEVIAVLLSILYVVFASRQNILCWPCALISTIIYAYLFWETTLIFHMMLNVYYVVMAVVGFVSWSSSKESHAPSLPVSHLSLLSHLYILSAGCLIALLLSLLASQWFTSEWVYLDAGTTVFSVFATVMVARKKIDNWYYWLAVNPLSAYLVYQNGLYPTSLLMIFYTLMSVYGLWQWRKDLIKGC